MTGREKKLLAALLVVAAAAGADQLWSRYGQSPKPVNAGQQLADVRKQLDALPGRLLALPLDQKKQYALGMAQNTIERSPFLPLLDSARKAQSAAGGTAEPPALTYTGYIAVGKKQLAVIGGMEYAVGDSVQGTGDVLRAIFPQRVVLFSPARRAEWELAYSGDDF